MGCFKATMWTFSESSFNLGLKSPTPPAVLAVVTHEKYWQFQVPSGVDMRLLGPISTHASSLPPNLPIPAFNPSSLIGLAPQANHPADPTTSYTLADEFMETAHSTARSTKMKQSTLLVAYRTQRWVHAVHAIIR
jgi:hypothetical protein